jgi:ABC-2 type transport system ATP-binding protein
VSVSGTSSVPFPREQHLREVALDPFVIEAVGLSRRFKGIVAVDGVSLAIPHGITFGLLGPNASGKSTLLRMLAGVLTPTAGEVRLLGRSPSGDARAQVGYMAQIAALIPYLTVWENLRLFAGLQGVHDRHRMHAAIAAARLTEHMHRPVRHLSGGMQRRASFACASVHNPKLLLLDEPTVGLDPTVRRDFWDQFARLNTEGVTVVVSTHIMDEAERCDQIGILREGRLLAQGSPAALRHDLRADSIEAAFVRLTEAQHAD